VTNSKPPNKSIATLSLPKPVPALITYAQSVVTAMTGNPSYPSPAPTLAAVTAGITALQSAEALALARTKGAVEARNNKRADLVTLLQQLRGYIQTVADADVETAATVIRSAGIAVRKAPARKARVFDAVQGAASGSAKLLAASAGRRASYEWQYSTDGGKTWLIAPATLQAKTTVTGLTPGATVEFRYRAVTKTGEGNWSQTVQLIVK
jgi:cell pole-organizing protein PopZ